MRECRLMQNDTEEKEMHAYDDTKPVEANSCMSALVWLARRDLWSSITAHHIIMFNILNLLHYVSISSVRLKVSKYMYKIILLAITKHTELFLQWPCFKINFTQWYQHQNTSPTHIKSYWKRFRTILSQASIRELQSTKITGLLLKPGNIDKFKLRLPEGVHGLLFRLLLQIVDFPLSL